MRIYAHRIHSQFRQELVERGLIGFSDGRVNPGARALALRDAPGMFSGSAVVLVPPNTPFAGGESA
jgi:hypothetical protein